MNGVAAAINPVIALTAVATLLGIAGVVGAAIVVLLRSTKNEIIADQATRILQLKEERGDCDEKVAHLSGRLEVLESDFVERIAMAVANAVLIRVEQGQAPQRRRRTSADD